MSAGHKHASPNLLVPSPKCVAMLHRLLTSPTAEKLMARWQHFDFDHDIPYLAGYDVFGTTRYADRDFVHALYEDDYARTLLGEKIDTGLSPEHTLACILRHEAVEKVIIDDPSNPIDLYDHHDEPGGWGAHEWATVAEHQLVKHLGGDPARYEAALKRIIQFCEHKPIEKAPRDYACAPYVDDPDANEQRIIRRLQELGVIDASKISKEKVEYHKTKGPDHCSVCKNWQGGRKAMLSLCAIVDGLVQSDRWCDKFEDAQPKPPQPAEEAQPNPEPAQQEPQAPQQTEAPQEPSAAAEAEQQAPAPASSAPPQPNPEVQALADSVAKMASAVHELVSKKSARKKRTITTKRDEHGNLTASVEDEPDETPARGHDLDHNAHAKWRSARLH